jgi:tetratricopeptide (TPR) repeat protein
MWGVRWMIPASVAVCGAVLYLLTLPLAVDLKPRHEQLITIPTKLLRVVSGQFKEVAADVSFLNVLTYLGAAKTQKDTRRYLPEQYAWVHSTLKNAAELDPHFMDPYYLMNSALVWDRYKVEEVLSVMAKGADIRTWDSMLPFFVGFNYYYFLNNGEQSVDYLKLASKRSGGNTFYDTLAARIAYKANKTELGIAYLEQQIHQTELEGRLDSIEPLKSRLEVLKGIRKIELAVEAYQKLFFRLPQDINELVKLGMLDRIPKDDLGGHYYLDAQGRVKSTKDTK